MPTPGERLTEALAAPGCDLPALVAYVTAGFPHLHDTVAVLRAVEEAGCAAVEVGIPFSDPLADGPTIQGAGRQALRQGMSMGRAIAQVAEARAGGVTIPVALMTYVNPVLARSIDRFCADAAAAGVDGVIVPDLPLEEAGELRSTASAHGLALVPLVAPTSTDERVAAASLQATGFVYCVGVVGTTGARRRLGDEVFGLLRRVREHTELPRAVGFGLSRHEHLVGLAGRCEAAVVGSALIDAMTARQDDPAAAAQRFLAGMLAGD